MRIAITGIGAISAIGKNCTETLQSLLEERSGIGVMRVLKSVHLDLPVGEVPYSNEELKAMAGISQNEPMPRTSLLGVIAAREALKMANCKCEAFISGTTVGGMDLTEQHWQDYSLGVAIENIHLHEAGESTNAIAKHLLSINESPFSFIATPSTACSSALNAIMLGANLLRTRQANSVLVGGAESLSKFHLNGFNSLMILDHQPCRPFDAKRNGLNLGEGAGYLVLEPEDLAIARGANILGYISGYANTCDAFHQTASSDNGYGAYLAMCKAIQMAELQTDDIDYINAHGTATPNNDISESAAIKQLFNDNIPAVSSTKAFTGHTTSACGGLETVICVLALQYGFVPANLNWANSSIELIQPITHTIRQPLRHILCNAFGFGGNESSLVISVVGNDLSESPIIEISKCHSIEVSDDTNISTYLSGAEARRLTPQTRRIVVAAKQVMIECGITQPDAIVCATRWGCVLQSTKFLQDMINSNEMQLKPTPFSLSTHNTIASLIASMTSNHGYNATYSQVKNSLSCAISDIQAQMSLGLIKTALVLEFDENVDAWDHILSLINEHSCNIARATIYKTKNKK